MRNISGLSLSSANTAIRTNALFYWKIIQAIVWVIGITIVAFLFFMPPIGVTLLWNILIPVAPALLVLGTGVWRNVCPLATTALIPDKFGFSKRLKLTTKQRSILNLAGVIALFIIIPLRHVIFNRNGESSGVLLVSIASIAFITGLIFERKSAWCSGICPVHSVEKLYGSGVAFTLPNAQCNDCVKCSIPCPDSTPNATVLTSKNVWSQKVVEYLIVGVLPGYIWGWFQIPDYAASYGWNHLKFIYGVPLMAGFLSLVVYTILKELLSHQQRKMLVNLFAAAAVSCYYWFRLPQLVGFRVHYTNSVLINLSNNLPGWTPIVFNIITTSFFIWWMVIRVKAKRSWAIRPAYSKKY